MIARSMAASGDADPSETGAAAGGAARRGGHLSLRQLRAFAMVARLGSFTAAARQMHLSQSALSALVRALESEMGLKLADRTTRRVELTAAGHDLLPMAQRLLADADRLAGDLRDLAGTRRGRVRLGATPLLATTLLPPLLARYAQDHAGVEVRLFDASADRLLAGLRAGELDLALAAFDRIESDLDAVPLLRDPMVLACPRAHPFAQRAQATWAQLVNQPLVLLRAGSGLRALVDRRFAALGVAPRIAHEVSQVATAVAMAGAGLGLAVVPAYALHLGLAGALGVDLAAVPLREPRVTRVVSLVHPGARTLSPAAQLFKNLLVDHLPRPSKLPPANPSRAAPAATRSRPRSG